MENKILLIGGGGHCSSVLDTILKDRLFYKSQIGIIDNNMPKGTQLLGVPVVGKDEDIGELYKVGYTLAFLTVVSMPIEKKEKLIANIKKIGYIFPNIIDSTAIVSPYSIIEEGIYIGKNTIINANSIIASFSTINNGCIVEHDCNIGSFVHLGPGSILCGSVNVGYNTHLGAGTIVKPLVCVGKNCISGSGSNIVKNVLNNKLVFGNPAIERM